MTSGTTDRIAALVLELAKDIDFAIDVTEPRDVLLRRFVDVINRSALLRDLGPLDYLSDFSAADPVRPLAVPPELDAHEVAALRQGLDDLKNGRIHTLDEIDRELALPALGAAPPALDPADFCSMCHGPYRFDTSIPSVVWNRVVRAQNLPEYLCLSCILKTFVAAGKSFTAELSGDGFHGEAIAVEINGLAVSDVAEIQQENNLLRRELAALRSGGVAQ